MRKLSHRHQQAALRVLRRWHQPRHLTELRRPPISEGARSSSHCPELQWPDKSWRGLLWRQHKLKWGSVSRPKDRLEDVVVDELQASKMGARRAWRCHHPWRAWAGTEVTAQGLLLLCWLGPRQAFEVLWPLPSGLPHLLAELLRRSPPSAHHLLPPL